VVTVSRFEQIQEFYRTAYRNEVRDLASRYPEERRLDVDWQRLAAWDDTGVGLDQETLAGETADDEYRLEDVHGLASDVVARPESMLDAFGSALQELDVEQRAKPMARATVSFENLPADATFTVGSFSPAEWEGRLLALEGQITKRTEVDPRLDEGAFECVRCGTMTYLPQPEFGSIREPHECEGCESTSTFFRLNENQSEWIDYQKIRLQQPPEDAAGETENIDVHLLGDLAGNERVEGGARTTFVGRLTPVYTGDVVFEKTVIGNGFTVEEGAFDESDLEEYRDVIDRLRRDENRFEILVNSFAPGHEGHWIEKAALVLQLFGGWSREGPDGHYHRGDSHIYLLGDPGTGKTMLLEAAHEVAPMAAITDGTGSSAAGLTAAITKDDFSSEQFSIEAGTLVRANNGIAVVDELDKGDTADLDALHTALESQEVHVSKAGKNARLPAKTALLAAGNPTGGHFDPTKEIADQVDLKSPLLSRFDLIFTLRASEDEDEIRDIAGKMIRGRQAAGKLARDEPVDPEVLAEVETQLDTEEFAAYLARAHECRPVVRDDAVVERMREWFVETKTSLPERYGDAMGAGEYDGPPLPITARKLDAVQRLAEASARVRLSETVEMRDVERVLPLVERSLADIGIAPRDNSAFGRVEEDVRAESIGIGD
jgi:replicative DNA helicase Mcm